MRKIKYAGGVLLLALLVIFGLTACRSEYTEKWDAEQEESDNEIADTSEKPESEKIDLQGTADYALGDSIYLVELVDYEGAYVEDGSDETVSGVAQVLLRNAGSQTLQYAELKLEYENEVLEFTFSTLFPNAKMQVLEKNRKFSANLGDLLKVTLDRVVFFEEEPQLLEEILDIQTLDGALNIRNISEEDITGKVTIYYKNYVDGVYLGGITYRISIENGINAGELRQVMADHFHGERSRIVFVTSGT